MREPLYGQCECGAELTVSHLAVCPLRNRGYTAPTTRDLIEAVTDPRYRGGSTAAIHHRYENLRVATLAVLDKLVQECEAEFTLDGIWNDDGQAVKLETVTLARLLRERLKR